MKKHLVFFFMLFLGLSINAETVTKSEKVIFDEITFKDNQIKVAGKYKGKFDVITRDINVDSKEKTTIYEVSIFDPEGIAVAKLDLQVTEKIKKKSLNVLSATLKTMRDNVSHNPSNFINYQKTAEVKSEELEVPQFDSVVKYLLSYNYF